MSSGTIRRSENCTCVRFFETRSNVIFAPPPDDAVPSTQKVSSKILSCLASLSGERSCLVYRNNTQAETQTPTLDHPPIRGHDSRHEEAWQI